MQSQVKRRIAFGLTTGGLFAGGGLGFAHADGTGSSGQGTASDSPGILAGNTIQIPVDIPINVCGVTANVLGLLNPAAGNECSNSGGATAAGDPRAAGGGASAQGGASDSPGVLSGNNVQVPVHIPVNVCGDSVNVVGLKNSALGNHCANTANTGGAGSSGSGGASATGGAHDSPGIGSGNNVQIPIDVPVNACGDMVNVVGLKNHAVDTHCTNNEGSATGGASAQGGASGSPGVLSGNNVQLPITVPVNVCGDTVNVVGAKNSAGDNSCANGAQAPSPTPSTTPSTSPSTTPSTSPSTPPISPPTSSATTSTPGGPTSPGGTGETSTGGTTPGSLAHTGSDALMLAPVGAAMLGGGTVLYRKYRPKGTH